MTDDDALRRHVYDRTLARGAPPTIAELSSLASRTEAVIRDGLARLAAARVLVQQHESAEILMVPPFSAVPTPFLVETSLHSSYANCAWDALGVPVMARQAARVVSSCGCCGEGIVLDVSPDGPPAAADLVLHFAVPAARWWQDIVFT